MRMRSTHKSAGTFAPSFDLFFLMSDKRSSSKTKVKCQKCATNEKDNFQKCAFLLSLPAWGAWIEIPSARRTKRAEKGRSPHGGRGLKLLITVSLKLDFRSLPAWGAWIEIYDNVILYVIEKGSLPAWGAWIEIDSIKINKKTDAVAPRMGGVD